LPDSDPPLLFFFTSRLPFTLASLLTRGHFTFATR
jgi:hypothetical protein